VTQIITKQAKLVKCNPKQVATSIKAVKKSKQPQGILKGFSINLSIIIFRGAYFKMLLASLSVSVFCHGYHKCPFYACSKVYDS